MRNQISEQTILFVSVVRWVILATIIGAIVGLGTALFLLALETSIKFMSAFPWYFLLIIPALFITDVFIAKLAPDAEGHGTEKVIEAVHLNWGKIKPLVVPVKLIGTILTLSVGGSAGKEGPAAQIGAGLSSIFSDFFHLNNADRRKLVICGISAGFAAVFGTPIAGAIFGVEVLFVGTLLYDVLLPSFIAGVISFHVANSFGLHYFYHPLSFIPVFTNTFFIQIIIAGIFFGVVAFIMIETLEGGKRLVKKLGGFHKYRGFLGGIALVALVLIFGTSYLGLGLVTIESTLQGAAQPWYSFLVKTVATSITLNFGGSGGIITPIFYVGSAAGSLFAKLMSLDLATFAALGMVAVLAGTANTPIAASILSIELFGPGIAPYATVVCIISFLMTGRRSVYPSQVFSIRKSQSLDRTTGKGIINYLRILKRFRKTLASKGFHLADKVKQIRK